MPIYPWRVLESGKEVEVLRPFSGYQDPPTKEECLAAGMTEEEYEAAEFEKIIGRGIRVTRGDNWGPGKGSW